MRHDWKQQHPMGCLRHPLPPPLIGANHNSFAYVTITERLPSVARRVLAENRFPTAIATRIDLLMRDIVDGRVQWFGDDGGPDVRAWARYAAPYLGRRWTEIPCCFAETYFYRAILAATQYFRPGPWRRHDPYAAQKRLGVLTASDAIQSLFTRLNTDCALGWTQHRGIALLHYALWGNRADLCLWPLDAGATERHHSIDSVTWSNLLVDDAPQLADRLASLRTGRVDFIVDNAGFELVCDLALVDYLLSTGRAATVHLHLKSHPTFVSDAIPTDVRHTLALLSAQHGPEVCAVVRRLQSYLQARRVQLYTDPFWTAPLVFWEMPQQLRQELAGADLVLVKGDMNYRRLVGDRQWPFTTPFADIVDYFPAPLAALRTLKAELAAGLEPQHAAMAAAVDPAWLTNGRWGVIQFAEPLCMTLPARTTIREAA